MNNFNLRKFLSENKLTPNSKLVREASVEDEDDKSGIIKKFKFGSENQFELKIFSNGDVGISDGSDYLGLTNKDAKDLSELLKQAMGLATEGQLNEENEEDMGDKVPAEKLAKFLFNLDFDPNDEVLKTAISFNDIEELLPIMADISGVGDEDERVAFDGLFTRFDFYDAAKKAGFEKHQIEYLLDHDYVRSLERG